MTPQHPDFKGELDWIAGLYAQAVNEELSLSPAKSLRRADPNARDELTAVLNGLVRDLERSCLLTVAVNGRKAGYFLGLVKDCVGEEPRQAGYVNGLYVLPDYRRQGIAQTLLDEGMRWFKGRGLKLVELYIAINNDAARGFWRKNGYLACEEVLIRKI